MEQILGIGLPQSLVISLASKLSARFYSADSIGEARLLLRHIDFSSVLMVLKDQSTGSAQIIDLLGDAPLTTRFVAIWDITSSDERANLERLGIKSVRLSGAEALLAQLH